MKWRIKKVKEMGRGEVSEGHGVSSSVDFSDFMTRFIQICLWVEKLFPKSCQKQFIELDRNGYKQTLITDIRKATIITHDTKCERLFHPVFLFFVSP